MPRHTTHTCLTTFGRCATASPVRLQDSRLAYTHLCTSYRSCTPCGPFASAIASQNVSQGLASAWRTHPPQGCKCLVRTFLTSKAGLVLLLSADLLTKEKRSMFVGLGTSSLVRVLSLRQYRLWRNTELETELCSLHSEVEAMCCSPSCEVTSRAGTVMRSETELGVPVGFPAYGYVSKHEHHGNQEVLQHGIPSCLFLPTLTGCRSPPVLLERVRPYGTLLLLLRYVNELTPFCLTGTVHSLDISFCKAHKMSQ